LDSCLLPVRGINPLNTPFIPTTLPVDFDKEVPRVNLGVVLGLRSKVNGRAHVQIGAKTVTEGAGARGENTGNLSSQPVLNVRNRI